MAVRDNVGGVMPESLVILQGIIATGGAYPSCNLFFNHLKKYYTKMDIVGSNLSVTVRGKGTYTTNTTNIDISDITNFVIDNPVGTNMTITLHN